MRLDPFPQFSATLGNACANPRVALFAIVMTKICLDRIYNYASVVNPNAALDSGGNETLDILEYQHPGTGEAVYKYLTSYGPQGRAAYQSLLMYDSGFLLFRTVPMCLLVHWAFKLAPSWSRPGVFIPLATTFIDLVENGLIWLLLKAYPRRLDTLAQLTAWMIEAKWAAFVATLVLMCVSGLVGIYYSFHAMLSNSVLMEKDRQEKLRARRHVTEVLHRSGKSSSSSAAAGNDKKKQ
ncbi:hypothetical protein BC941DRAFT_419972 [Chlamydoabsidia padenii]|nr:hypothetical protein BC941DRAFT_419972 [Chlamydoabsidia padenii]